MWDGLFMLLSLSFVMAVASFLAGSLPIFFSLSQRHLRLVTALGAGVLIGTSLIIVIPEGIETLYSASPSHSSSPARHALSKARGESWLGDTRNTWSASDLARSSSTHSTRTLLVRLPREGDEYGASHDGPVADDALPGGDSLSLGNSRDDIHSHPEPEHDDHDYEPHAWVGAALVAGFVLMYLIDKLPQVIAPPSQPRRFYISLDRLTLNRRPSQVEAEDAAEEGGFGPGFGPVKSRTSSTTVGLVIHAAADGIALGSSTTSSSSRLSLVIFTALMIHKAPAAFGLTSVLLRQGMSKRRARAHLLIFSLAAPVGALTTWSIANIFGDDNFGGSSGGEFATGLLLLFSGGTFLYVAMHTMQESGHDHGGRGSHDETAGNGYTNPYQLLTPKHDGPTITETLATVGGMLLPLLIQLVGHGH